LNRLLELARLLKPSLVFDWYHQRLAHWLVRCADGDGSVPNLLISTPPGSGKTELVSILFPAYIFAQNPQAHVIALANSHTLATMTSGNVLRLIQHPEFQTRWPLTLDKATEAQWTIHGNDGRPSMHAAGIMGQLTGQSADYLIFDDLIKSQSEAYSEVLRDRTWANFSSAAETRLLPDGKIIGISTRWHLDDPIGRLLRRAQEDKRSRQFLYVSLAAWNGGEDSFVLDTRTGERKFLPAYQALASSEGQPYSFSRKQLLGKQADLGTSRFSALYMQQPQSLEDQLFPEKVWGTIDQVNSDDLLLVASAWDCASRTGEKNDFTANVVIARRRSGGFVVLDVWKSKLNFAKLPDVVLQRYVLLNQRYKTMPLLVVEDADAGRQLIDTIKSREPQIPLIAAKPVKAKIIRAEGVTPITTAGLVALPREAHWRADFVKEMGDFPVGQHDDVADAFCHGMKSFTTERDFKAAELSVLPGRVLSEQELDEQEAIDELEYPNATRLGDGFGDDF
jgi:predicted phage terminase large subunit-like protein